MNQQITKSTVAITIGRDVDGQEMTAENWQGFQQRVVGSIIEVGGEILYRPSVSARRKGDGVWQGRVQEEAAAFVAFVPTIRLRDLKARLRYIAEAYDQDAVGFIVAHGTENLIYTASQQATA